MNKSTGERVEDRYLPELGRLELLSASCQQTQFLKYTLQVLLHWTHGGGRAVFKTPYLSRVFIIPRSRCCYTDIERVKENLKNC